MSRWLASDEKSDLGSLVSKLKESYNDITTDGSNITMSNTDSDENDAQGRYESIRSIPACSRLH